ncbi:MAG: Mth938-like domain-containing protein, partial [Steroidobacteraceae bacterium]
MEFTREVATDANAIVACLDGEIRLRDRAFTSSLILTRNAILDHWRPEAAENLTIADFTELLGLAPEVVLLGTGSRQRIPPPELYAAFAERGIGLEVMDNRAACRTYNLLLSEFREVAVALM